MNFNEIVIKEKDGKTIGKIECTDKEVYLKECPVNKSTIKELNNYNKQYIEKMSEVMIEKGIEEFNKNEKLDKILITVPMSLSDKYTGILNRKKTFNNFNKESEPITKSTVTFVTRNNSHSITENTLKELEDKLTKAVCR